MTDHDKLTELLKPVVEFIHKKGFHHMILIGKDGVCTRYVDGNADELSGMLKPKAREDKVLNEVLKQSIV